MAGIKYRENKQIAETRCRENEQVQQNYQKDMQKPSQGGVHM